MIIVVGTGKTSEYAAALQLKDLMSLTWPSVAKSNDHLIYIVPSAKCYGQKRKDIDILVFDYRTENMS